MQHHKDKVIPPPKKKSLTLCICSLIQIKEEMERLQVEDVQREQEHHTTLEQMEEQRRDVEAQALEYEAQAKETTETLDQIKTGERRQC